MIEGQASYLEQRPDKKVLESLILSGEKTLEALERRKETAPPSALRSVDAQIMEIRNRLADLREQLREVSSKEGNDIAA